MKIITMIIMLISLAIGQLGKPYKWGAEGPNKYDCSGLAVYCYQEIFDITLPRSAKNLGYCEDYERIENIEDLEIGDIICFNTNSRDHDLSDHIGIYIGRGYFIHASSSKGKVIISPITEGFYNRTFSWGLRIISDDLLFDLKQNS